MIAEITTEIFGTPLPAAIVLVIVLVLLLFRLENVYYNKQKKELLNKLDAEKASTDKKIKSATGILMEQIVKLEKEVLLQTKHLGVNEQIESLFRQHGFADPNPDPKKKKNQDLIENILEPATDPLDSARKRVDLALLSRHWILCPCCHQDVKLYKRKLNSGMIRGLIELYKIQNKPEGFSDEWVHVANEFTQRKFNYANAEFSKLKFWGFIEEKPNKFHFDKRTSGYWRITEKGKDFLHSKITVPRHILIYNSKQFPTDEIMEPTDVIRALGDKFNYTELMNA